MSFVLNGIATNLLTSKALEVCNMRCTLIKIIKRNCSVFLQTSNRSTTYCYCKLTINLITPHNQAAMQRYSEEQVLTLVGRMSPGPFCFPDNLILQYFIPNHTTFSTWKNTLGTILLLMTKINAIVDIWSVIFCLLRQHFRRNVIASCSFVMRPIF